jgi:hypothetical protein
MVREVGVDLVKMSTVLLEQELSRSALVCDSFDFFLKAFREILH